MTFVNSFGRWLRLAALLLAVAFLAATTLAGGLRPGAPALAQSGVEPPLEEPSPGSGNVPGQRNWLVGGPRSLRGYDAGVLSGNTFLRGRVEAARTFRFWGVSMFGDAAWAGPAETFDPASLLYGVGLGASVLDGLIRADLCQGLTEPAGGFRIEIYLDGVL